MSDGATSVDEGSTLSVSTILKSDEVSDFEPVTEMTVPELLRENASERPDEVALRHKHHGIWKEYTWSEYFEIGAAVSRGFETLGFESGDVLYTIGYNRPQQLWTWVGAQILGGKAAPEYEGSLPDEMLTQMELIEPTLVYAEDQEMVDKVLNVADDLPWVEAIVYNEPKGLDGYEHPEIELVQFDDLLERGRSRMDQAPLEQGSPVDEQIRDLEGDRIAMLPPTSGTTGPSKRVRVSHSNYINLARSTSEIYDIDPGANYFSFLPMAWGGEQMIVLGAALLNRWVVNYAEEPETEQEDFREIGPEVMVSSPHRYEDHVADVKARIENSTRLKQWVYDKAMSIGERYAEYVSGDKRDESPPAWLSGLHFLSYWAVYRPILDKIGLKRAKNVYTGGGPLGEDHFEFYHAMGLPLKQIWGQSEVCGFVTMHRDEDIQVETVGEVFPNVEVGITPGGELLVRGPVVTSGYYGMPEKTESAIEDGWLHTDDFGALTDEGHVKIFDRMDDVLEMNDGTAVAPISVETKLKFNPYVKEAMVIGDGRDELTAVLNIRYDNVAEWADQRDIQYAGYRDLTRKEPVLELMRGVVAETNEELEHPIQRFLLLFKEFDADDGELTRTGKLRREVVMERYDELVESLYDGSDEVEMEITITYQDGRESDESGVMHIVDVDEPVDENADIEMEVE